MRCQTLDARAVRRARIVLLGAKLDVSETSVLKVWHATGLTPHLTESFKVSRNTGFVEKLEDIVGLYLMPPGRALVLCCDEKSQVQTPDRTQPGLPMRVNLHAL